MAERPAQTTPALDKISALKTRLSRKSPAFGEAVATDAAAERFCGAIRQMIVDARVRAGWDQAELARRVDYSQSTISRLESGKAELSVRVLFHLAAALGRQPELTLRDGEGDATVTTENDGPVEIEILDLMERKVWVRIQDALHEGLKDSIDEIRTRQETVE